MGLLCIELTKKVYLSKICITGGEPLLDINRTINVIKIAKGEFKPFGASQKKALLLVPKISRTGASVRSENWRINDIEIAVEAMKMSKE